MTFNDSNYYFIIQMKQWKKHGLALFLAFLPFLGWNQEVIQFKDSITQQPVSHVEVWLFQKGRAPQFFYSDTKGRVELRYQGKVDSIVIRAVGYKPITLTRWGPIVTIVPVEFHLGEQVITEHYHGTYSSKTPYDISIIRAREGEAVGMTSVAELLRLEPSLQVDVHPMLGTTLRLLGFGGKHVKILINGVPVIGRINGEIDLSQLPISNIERIEIVKGPMAAYYGSDAIGGVINIITRRGGKSAQIKALYESIGQYNIDLQIHTPIQKAEGGLVLGRYFFDGWDPTPDQYRRYQLWKPKQLYFAQGSFRRPLLKKTTLQWLPSIFYETLWDQGEPIITPYRAYAMDGIYTTWRSVNSLSLNGYIRPDRYLDFQFNHSLFYRTKHTYIKDMTTLHTERASDPSLNDTTFFQEWNLRGVYSMNYQNTKINYQIGYDFHLMSGMGDRVSGKRRLQEYASFASIEYRPWTSWRFRLNLRYPYNTFTPAPLVPSFHIVHEWNEFLTTKCSIGRGFRLPDMKELYLYFVDINHNIRGNPNLKPEHSWTFQVATRYMRLLHQHYALQVGFTPYWSRVNDLIQLILIDGGTNLYSYTNVSQFQSAGFTIDGAVRSPKWRLGLGWTQNWNQYEGITMPESRLNFQSNFHFLRKLSFNTILNYFIQMNQLVNDGTTYLFRSVPSYVLWDMTLKYQHKEEKGFSFQVGVKNLLDVRDLVVSGGGGVHSGGGGITAIAPGRRYLASLTWQF